MKKLVRNGIEGIFSDADIKSGQPQRYGWQEPGKEKKELPKEIIQFIERRRPPDIQTVQDELDELSKPEAPKATTQLTEKKQIRKPKAQIDDNPKQKDGTAAKRKPGRVAKN